MKYQFQSVLCSFGVHDLRYVGEDKQDRIYRCSCGHMKVERYTLKIDRIGWTADHRPSCSLMSLLLGKIQSKAQDAVGPKPGMTGT